ncbi:MAG: NAD(P)/FAD-dependent oxidoreductase [Thermoanaerobaculaceae bacterium]
MTPEFDVVVIGCGPAGNTAAYRLASAGVRVLMVDKEALPRHKVCGGGLSAKALRESPFSLSPVIERQAGVAFIACDGGHPVRCERPGIGAMVQRAVLDGFMARRAVTAGAVLRERESFESFESRGGLIKVRTSSGAVTARVLVGADGVYSRVRMQLLPRAAPHLVPAIEALLWPAPGVLDLVGDACIFDLGAIPAGYGWVFPKRDHLNVGLYRYAKRRDNLDVRGLLEAFIARYRILRGYERIAVKALCIPVMPVARRLASHGVLLVGDAAGVGDPMFGEGIYSAIRSGNLAAEAIVSTLEGKCTLSSYDRRMRGLRFDLAAARLAARLFYTSPRLGFRFGVRNRLVSNLFMGVLSGTVSPAKALAGMAGLTPYWLLARPSPPVASPIFDQ